MYCKHCGKEIVDDSKFCQHCGGKLDTISSVPKIVSKPKNKEAIVTTKSDSMAMKFYAKNKIYIVLYYVWLIINILFLLQGEEKVYEITKRVYPNDGFEIIDYTFKATEVFYPFTSTGFRSSYMFNVKYYDWTEFLVYCLLIPVIVYALVMFLKRSFGKSVETSIIQSKATEQNKTVETCSKLTSAKNVIEEKKNNKEEANSGMTNKTPTQTKYDYGVYDDNYNNIYWNGFLDFIVAAFKIFGVIFFTLLAFALSFMFIPNFYLGCILSISSGILSFYLIKKNSHTEDESSDKSKEERSPLYYTGLIVFTILLLFACYKIGESFILKSINSPSPSTIENTDAYKEEVKEKPAKQSVHTDDSYNNDRNTSKEFDSQMKTIDNQMKMIEEKEKISRLPSENDYYY